MASTLTLTPTPIGSGVVQATVIDGWTAGNNTLLVTIPSASNLILSATPILLGRTDNQYANITETFSGDYINCATTGTMTVVRNSTVGAATLQLNLAFRGM